MVPDVATISDVNVSLQMSHTWVGDLTFTLTQQSTNRSAVILDRPLKPGSTYGCRYDDIMAILGDEANSPVENECKTSKPTINGSFIPNELLSVFDGGQSTGSWLLTVVDNDSRSENGILHNWGIQICSGGDAPVGSAFSENFSQLVASEETSETLDSPYEKGEIKNVIFLPLITR